MTLLYYICPVLPSEPAVLNDAGDVVTRAKPQRCKIADLDLAYKGYVTDIPVDDITGLALKSWAIVAVEAEPSIHIRIAKDVEVWPIRPDASSKSNVRAFLASKGEIAPPDKPQAVLECLHSVSGSHVPQISDLRVG